MPVIPVLFWFDVEDYLTPESDDALLGIIKALDAHDVRGTFKLVGEKLRVLKKRGRWDIIDAMRKHDIGYHTDFHSVHPTPAEYLKDLDWEVGIAEFERRELAGFEELRETYGVTPSCYGQPGSSWAPQVYSALRKWGVPVYLDEAGQVGLNDEPFWYCGTLNIFNLQKNATRFNHRKGENGLGEGMARFDAIHQRLLQAGSGAISIWYHPCEYATHEFWDAVNFSNGANPERANWRLPRMKTREELASGIALFDRYVEYIRSRPHVRCITAREAVALYPDEVTEISFRARDIIGFAQRLGSNLTYCQVGNAYLTPAEILYLTVSLLKEAVHAALSKSSLREVQESVAGFDIRVPVGIYGPVRRIQSDPAPCDGALFLKACGWAKDYVDAKGRVPEAIPWGEGSLSPTDFLVTANSLLAKLFENPSGAAATLDCLQRGGIEPLIGQLELEKQVTGEGVWDWEIFPQGFDAPKIIELARLQTWSLKPARR